MKLLVMTEGTCELAMMNVLLERELLMFKEEDLLFRQMFQARQIDEKLKEMISQLPISETLKIIRIGDKLTDKLEIPEDLTNRVASIETVCIRPEFEILHIIKENKLSSFIKVKTNFKASEYYMAINRNYKKTYKCNYSYFSEMDNSTLVNLFKDYDKKRKGAHNKTQLSITALLR